jgi:hypothetical protein
MKVRKLMKITEEIKLYYRINQLLKAKKKMMKKRILLTKEKV